MVTEAYTMNKVSDLANIDIEIPKLATVDNALTSKDETMKVTLNGVPIDIEIERASSLKDNGQLSVDITINVSTNANKNIACLLLIVLKDQNGMCTADTNVNNKDRKLQGLGRVLWEISLKLIQKIANELNIPIIHEVNKKPYKGLNATKWNNLFFPLLEKHLYLSKGSGLWERIYIPDKNEK